MNPFTKQFHTEAENVRLTSAERSRIYRALHAEMEKTAPTIVPSPFFPTNFFFSRAMVAVALILVLGTGTATYAAEASLPGDLLYPVKVNVSEPITGVFAFTPSAKAEWHARVAEARLAEAETLTERGTLTEDTSVALSNDFNAHAAAVTDITTTIRESDPVSAQDIDTLFQSAVAHHGSAILVAAKNHKNELALKTSGDFVVSVVNDTTDVPAETGVATAAMAAPVTASAVLTKTASPAPMPVQTVSDSNDNGIYLAREAHTLLSIATSSDALLVATTHRSNNQTVIATAEGLVVKGDAYLSVGMRQRAIHDFTRAITLLKTLTEPTDTTVNSGTILQAAPPPTPPAPNVLGAP